MPTICHLFDGNVGWEQRLAASQLIERLPVQRYPWHAATVDRAAVRKWTAAPFPIATLGRPFPGPFRAVAQLLAAGAVGRLIARKPTDIIHAWGVSAAFAAWVGLRANSARRAALVVELFDPAIPRSDIKRLRTLTAASCLAIICSTQTIRRRLIEGGIPPDCCVVVRPGVDFGQVNHWRRGNLREKLGLSSDHRVILIPQPIDRKHGFMDAFFAGLVLCTLTGNTRVIVPGDAREARRIARFARCQPLSETFVAPDPSIPFEQLVSCADVLVVPAPGDISTTSIAWAMAAGVAVIGAAGYAVAELIAHKVNGLLFKAEAGKSMAAPIVRWLRDHDSLEKVREAARGQAYEVFSIRRYVDQHIKLYENVCAGVAAGEGISDSAAVG